MPTVDVPAGTKVIIELDQSGNPLGVYLAGISDDGAPITDVLDRENEKPKHRVSQKTLRASMEFHAGNCVCVNGRWFCY